MSRSYKITFILQCRSSLPLYRDLSRISDRELDEEVHELIRRMDRNDCAVIARMRPRVASLCLN